MGTKTDTFSDDTGKLHLPLEPLFTLLHNNGFQVKPDDYVEMLKVTERFGSENIDDTAKWICPIVATNETEQVKFYNIIEEYKKLIQPKPEITPEQVIPRKIKILLPLIVIVLALAALYYFINPNPIPPESNVHQTVKTGSRVSLTVKDQFAGREKDTQAVKTVWTFEEGSRETGASIEHTFSKPGQYVLIRDYTAGRFPRHAKRDTAFIYACNDIPTVELVMPADVFLINKKISVKALIQAAQGTVTAYQWKLNDSVITTKTPVLNDISFSKAGNYFIECTAVVGEPASPCSVTASQPMIVLDDGINYSGNFSHFQNKQEGGQTELKWWVNVVLLVPAALGLFYSLFKRKKQPSSSVTGKAPSVGGQPKPETRSGKQPYDIPFERTDLKLVQPERDLRLVLLQMRMKAEEENLVLNVLGTINSIIRSGGSPQLVFTPQVRQQEYLVLVDKSNPKSMMGFLFEYLVGIMSETGIPVSCYFYDTNFNCYNKQNPTGISLQRLADIHSKATLIIMGKAYELVYRAYPVIEEKYLHEFNRWELKAIITPIPALDWSTKEKVLQEYFILLPADLMALQKLMPSLKEKIKLKKNQLDVIELNPYSILYIDFRDVGALKKYLDNDEVLFQWLCAACVYPRLRWEVLVETGKAILDKYGQPEKLKYSTLLKICRISWMQEGVFPQATRLELLKLLAVENERCARETILHMLNYSSILYKGDGYAFEEEKNRQRVTNEFVLYSNNRDEYKRFADSEQAFQKIWVQNNILDAPLKKYLEKPSGDWQTPVQVNKISVGLPAYFKDKEVKASRPQHIKRILAGIASVVLIALWNWLGYWGGAQDLGNLKLNQYKASQEIDFSLAVQKDFIGCGDSSSRYFDTILANIEINNNSYPAIYDKKTGIAGFKIPYQQYQTGMGQLTVDWGNENPDNRKASGINALKKNIQTNIDFTSKLLPDSLIVRCNDNTVFNVLPPIIVDSNKRTVWNDIGLQSLPSSLNEIWTGRTANRLVNINIGSRNIWYSTKEKNTYGTYRIESVFKNRSGQYKVIVSGNNNQFRAIMLRNITQNSFDLSICPIVGTKDEIIKNDSLNCGNYDRMNWYYEGNKDNIYLPLNANTLVASEKSKLDRKADSIKGMKDIGNYRMLLFENKQYTQQKNITSTILNVLGNSYIEYPKGGTGMPANLNSVMIISANPFNRSYLQISGNFAPTVGTNATEQKQKSSGPDCFITYTTLEDVRKSPNSICKLDLSKAGLKEIPKELFACRNLQELILGQTEIPEASIKNLQSYLPKCKIIYTIIPPVSIKDTSFIQTRVISFGVPGEVPKTDITYIYNLASVLSSYPDARIRLVAYYKNETEKQYANNNITAIKNLLYTGKQSPNNSQVLEQVLEDPNLYKLKKASASSNFIFQSELGTGSMEFMGEPPTKVTIYVSSFPASFFGSKVNMKK